MCDSELIVSYLYDELNPAERRSLERHLASCDACRTELDGLRGTRTTLLAWTPPELDRGFEIVSRPGGTPARRRAFHLSPAWGLAAAAVLVLAAASAVANVEVQVSGGGIVIRTGWNRPSPGATEPDAAAARLVNPSPVATEYATVTERLREIETALAARSAASTVGPVLTSSVSQTDLLRQVRQLIAESEKRQDAELALMIAQVHRDVDAARRADFGRMQQALAQFQGLNDAQVLWQRQVEDRLLRVGQQQR